MAPKRKAKASSAASKKKKTATQAPSKAEVQGQPKEQPDLLSFERYADEEEGVITMEGLARFAEELGIDAASDTKLLALCWRLGAEKPGVVSRSEWVREEEEEEESS